ncbi:MAG: hypothetical protein ACE5KY_00445, partial [Candidatus Tectimicrobiota bacterium]
AYHVMPRFSGQPMRYPRLIWPHFWLTNGGLIGMATAWLLGPRGATGWEHFAGLFGVAISVGLGLFIVNMVTTIRAVSHLHLPTQPPCARPT